MVKKSARLIKEDSGPVQPSDSADPHSFVFELDLAFRAQVIGKLEASPMLPLYEVVAPSKRGVYALYWKGSLVYAGKALGTTLRRRLAEQSRKISARQNIALSQMTCRFLTIESDWYVREAERALIATYKPTWNTSGFGNQRHGPRVSIRRS